MNVLARIRRLLAVVGVSLRRSYVRATKTAPGRTWMSIGGVALAVGLMVVVAGIGVGIATQSTVYGDNVDYWITPESEGSSSALIDTDGPQLDSVHPTASELSEHESIEYASPVLTQPLRIETDDGTADNVLAVGVINQPGFDAITDVTTEGLTEADPYYETNTWTGEIVASAGTAELLSATEGDAVVVTHPRGATEREFSVVTVDPGTASESQFPIVVMQLSELQAITGADRTDQAEQFVVSSNDPAIEPMLAEVYPHSTVSTRAGLNAQAVFEDELPLALSVTAAIIAVVIGTLFVMTTTGLSVAADRSRLSTLAAIGVSRSTRFRLLASELVLITVVGGLIGLGLGIIGIRGANIAAQRTVISGTVASTEPFVLASGLVIAGVIGVLSLPYLAILLRRVGTATEVGR